MATHRVKFSEGDSGNVGNSISTTYECRSGEFVLNWRGKKRVLPAKEGDAFLVGCYGGFPQVTRMKSPSHPTAKAAWDRGFYSSKRFGTLEELYEAASKETAWSQSRGMNLPSVKVWRSEHCAFAYKAVAEWQRSVPFGWWEQGASVQEVESLLEEALSSYVSEGW